MKRAFFLFTVFFAFALAANAQGLTVGAAMDNFSLPDTNGKPQSLADLKGKNGTVFIVIGRNRSYSLFIFKMKRGKLSENLLHYMMPQWEIIKRCLLCLQNT